MFGLSMMDIWRWVAACGVVISYFAFCYYKYGQSKRSQYTADGAADQGPSGKIDEQIWIVYASQSGQAEAIARQSAQALSAAHRLVHLRRIDDDWMAEISAARYVFFVVSTYGEGSAPDHALRFSHTIVGGGPRPEFRGMKYGFLALGDKNYPAYCAFGRQMDAWLQASGARPQFERIEVDKLDAESLSSWQQRLFELGASSIKIETPIKSSYASWRFIERRCLNNGSPGNPIYLVVLQAEGGVHSEWQAGDLVDVLTPGGDGYPRAYSIANLPSDGRIELIVRKHIRDDGQVGQASGWLTEQAMPGDALPLKVRSNPGFHLAHDLLRPLILIGSGAGISGLRAHLQAREKAIQASGHPAPQRNAWLFFGERSGRHDHLCQLEIEAWKRAQVLNKVDMSFSRDDPVTPYVQHNLLAQSKEVCEWIKHGAQILICGNAQKMAPGVDQTLRRMLGSDQVDMLFETGRIRRDVY